MASSAALQGDDIGSVTSALTAADSTWDNTRIRVCWQSFGSATQDGRRWSQDAVENSWEAVSAVDFFGWGVCTPSDTNSIKILISDVGPHTKGLGSDLAGVDQGMVLNFTFRNWGEACQAQLEFCIRAIAVHEFGHALGFAHEHNRSDRVDCTSEPQGPTGTVSITSYDAQSIMNYCSSAWNNNGSLTSADVAGVRATYGPFTTETPACFVAELRIDTVNDEFFGSDIVDEFRPPTFDFCLSQGAAPQVRNFSFCERGEEVRIETTITAQLNAASARGSFTTEATMFEGGDCSTDDNEGNDSTSASVSTVSSGSATMILDLVNDEFAGGDTAHIEVEIAPNMAGTLADAAAGRCDSCDDAANDAYFGPDFVVIPILPIFPFLPLATCHGETVTINMQAGDSGEGSSEPDVILGTAGDDVIEGLGGNDRICGGGGDDQILGGPGNDIISGEDGDDVIYGGGGNDSLMGNDGIDTIFGQYGGDTIRGGDDDDLLLGGPGYDTLYGENGNDNVQGAGGNDTLWGGPGNDYLYGKPGNDIMHGEAGDDEMYAASGDDEMYGGPGADRLQGASGDDEMFGGGDDDVLYGQAGDDEMHGDAGDDVLYAAVGNDRLWGGPGQDNLQGANGDDELFGEADVDTLFGQGGNDLVDGGAAADNCFPGGGNNTVVNC